MLLSGQLRTNDVSVLNTTITTSELTTNKTAGNGSLTVEVIQLQDELNNPISRIRHEWLQLYESDLAATILEHPDYTLAEVPFLPSSHLPNLLIVCRSKGRLVGLGTLLCKVSKSKHVGGIGPSMMLHGYRLAGSRFLTTGEIEIQTLLMEAATQEVVRRGAQYLLIEDLDEQSSLLQLAKTYLERDYEMYSPTSFQVRLKIDLPRTSAEYFSKFSSKTRNTFKRKEKKLGQIKVVRCSTLDQIPDFLRDAHQISLNTWQTDQFGIRVEDDERTLRLFTFLALQGALRSYVLYQGETPMAFIIGNQHRGLYRYEEVGFDRKFQSLSPGQVLLLKVLDDMFADNPPERFDFGMGDADYKRMLANVETTAGNIWLVPPGIRGRALVAYLNTSRSIRQVGRKVVKMLGQYRKLRSMSRAAKTTSTPDAAAED